MSDQDVQENVPTGSRTGSNAYVFETALGFFAIAWSAEGITRCILPEPTAEAASRRLSERGGRGVALVADEAVLPANIGAVVDSIRRYAEGDETGFDEIPLDLTGIDAFRRAIYAAARRLKHGEITTYGQLADNAGFPGMARETGTALGRNPIPLIVPCHRIIAAGGKLGGFSAAGGTATKQRLLAHERATPPAANPAQASFGF